MSYHSSRKYKKKLYLERHFLNLVSMSEWFDGDAIEALFKSSLRVAVEEELADITSAANKHTEECHALANKLEEFQKRSTSGDVQERIANSQRSSIEAELKKLVAVAADIVERQHAAIKLEKNAWQEEKQHIDETMLLEGPVVELNVGGTTLDTTLKTLCTQSNSMLAAMFSGRHTVIKDKDGRYFIDRNGDMFSLLLDALREGAEWVPQNDQSVFTRLWKEAKYFGLTLRRAGFGESSLLHDGYKDVPDGMCSVICPNQNRQDRNEIMICNETLETFRCEHCRCTHTVVDSSNLAESDDLTRASRRRHPGRGMK